MHRILIGVVVAGAVVIAGIGFAGSYAAVRELALQKGFGNFSYVFPIGIDAGICVLLALDLLLTWIRIPFPLLRQTAWLLTAATIAFNGAAAWPDPLGTGMHAVIPILFVVSVEAARHAIGRIADITADKHMEGVRLTRWLLSPLPTFLLWRRMKLWELRSYEQVIKLEQERLVYQARLRSRFGRAWRRKAPVESLMPLRLARYGVPLAETAPAGLAAAGIEPVLLPPVPRQPQLDAPAADHRPAVAAPAPRPDGPGAGPHRQPVDGRYQEEPEYEPEQDSPRRSVDDAPLKTESLVLPATASANRETHAQRMDAAVNDALSMEATGRPAALTTVDHYYLAWLDYQAEQGEQPTTDQLSTYLTARGFHGRGGNPINPATLRRYSLPFRVYNVWAEHRTREDTPLPDIVAKECTTRGITAQYNKPVTAAYIRANSRDFQRRWGALSQAATDTRPPPTALPATRTHVAAPPGAADAGRIPDH
ncbi:DUF2637 domain-containing protein [Streptomyces sp. NPDC086783]|uniref:DUF2637 domain-containing protein n=1 Tax=Streptomyces sp. NPDC086783 TaxID=3365758 RepID=UPI003826D1E2